jgi:hypothetical protein
MANESYTYVGPNMERRQWQRSVPVERRVDGADSAVLRSVKLEFPDVSLRWDPARQVVTIWRYDLARNRWFYQDDSPYGPYLDSRIVVALRLGDTRNYGSRAEFDAHCAAQRAKEKKDKQDRALAKVDFGAEAWRCRNMEDELNSCNSRIKSFVPGSFVPSHGVLRDGHPGLVSASSEGEQCS